MYRCVRSVRKKYLVTSIINPFEIEDDIFAMVSGCRVFIPKTLPHRA